MEHSTLSRQSVRKFSVGLELLSVSAYAFSRAVGNPPRQIIVGYDYVLSSAGYCLIRLSCLSRCLHFKQGFGFLMLWRWSVSCSIDRIIVIEIRSFQSLEGKKHKHSTQFYPFTPPERAWHTYVVCIFVKGICYQSDSINLNIKCAWPLYFASRT